MVKNTYFKIVLLVLLAAFSACDKKYPDIQTVDNSKMDDYIKKNNLADVMTKDPSGFYYQVTSAVTGTTLLNTDSVYYTYDMRGLDGAVYVKENPFIPIQTLVGYAALGWNYVREPTRKTLIKLTRGGSANLIVPSDLAYGKNGINNIPSNAVILSTIKVLPFNKRYKLDDYLLNKFSTDNNLGLAKDASRCYYKIITPGTGTDAIGPYSTITVNYTVRLLDGTQKDSSTDGTYASRLDNLYKGWRLMLPGKLTAGGKMRLLIPSDSSNGTDNMDFDIEIVKVVN